MSKHSAAMKGISGLGDITGMSKHSAAMMGISGLGDVTVRPATSFGAHSERAVSRA
jgi:hypothetical protein